MIAVESMTLCDSVIRLGRFAIQQDRVERSLEHPNDRQQAVCSADSPAETPVRL